MRRSVVVALILAGCGGGSGSGSVRPKTFFLATPQALESQSRIVFEFESSVAGSTFEAVLDGEQLGEVANPLVLDPVSDGPHHLRAYAVAPNGERDPGSVSYSWTVDTLPPVVRVTFPPPQSFTDQDEVAVCGTTEDAGGIQSLLVNGVRATSRDGFRTWRAVVPVPKATGLWAEALDVAGRSAVDKSRTIVPVAPPKPWVVEEARDEFELLIDEDAGEAIVVERTCVTAIDLETGERRVVSDSETGVGTAFRDIVVMAEIPGTNDITLFDTFQCRIFTVDLATGNRSVPWEALGKSDIPATREGLIASDGTTVYVQGPRLGNLVALDLDGSNRRTIASAGWVKDAIALTWDAERNRLLAIDAGTGNLYAVDPDDGTKSVISSHDADYPVGYERGLVIDGDRAFTIARDRNGILEIDLDSGERQFLPMLGDGLEDPRAIALHEDEGALIVLDHGRTGLMLIDLESGDCRETAFEHASGPECVGPIYRDPRSGELCLLDGGSCALVGVNPGSGSQRTIANLAEDAPDAVDFHMNPVTGEPVVLERHGIYKYENGCTSCREVPMDPDAPLGAGLALRVEAGGDDALVLDSRPYTIDKGWKRYTIRKDSLVRVNLTTGQCSLVRDQPAAGFSEIATPTGGMLFDAPRDQLLFGASECTDFEQCYHATLRVLDLTTNEAKSIYGVTRSDDNSIYFVGGTTDPPQDFGAIAYDPKHNEYYTIDREYGVIGRIHFREANPRYEVFSGDLPRFAGEWITVPLGHGPSLDGARGIAVDPDAGIAYVTTFDRVLAVDVRSGDRVVAAILK